MKGGNHSSAEACEATRSGARPLAGASGFGSGARPLAGAGGFGRCFRIAPSTRSFCLCARACSRTYVRSRARTSYIRAYVRTYLFSLLRSRTHVRARARASMLPPRRPPPLGDFPHSLGKRKRAKAFSSFPFQTPAPCLADVPGCRRMNGKVARSIFERAPMAVVGRNAARRPYQSAIRPQVRPESWREGEGCSSPMPSRARTRARARGRARGRAGCRWL